MGGVEGEAQRRDENERIGRTAKRFCSSAYNNSRAKVGTIGWYIAGTNGCHTKTPLMALRVPCADGKLGRRLRRLA